jgi:protein SCO1/2
MIMRHSGLLFALLLFVAVGCSRQSPAPATSSDTRTFPAHGYIRQIAPDRRTATIQHDAIAGYMGAMTMDFPIQDTNALSGISPGDEINFQLVVSTNDDWVQGIQLIAHHVSDVASNVVIFHSATDELKAGDLLPDGELTTENGDIIHFSDFHGRALAFTFFFTSCPLPDFCPKMNRNFAEARQLLAADTNAPANWQFLSISFDPIVDQPAVLGGYAGLYRGADTNRWLFAVAGANTLAGLAPRLDLQFWRENGSITHNLRTVVLDPDGRITRQFDGNDWTPRDLADAMRQAAKTPVP